jgi:hypothetical protein
MHANDSPFLTCYLASYFFVYGAKIKIGYSLFYNISVADTRLCVSQAMQWLHSLYNLGSKTGEKNKQTNKRSCGKTG